MPAKLYSHFLFYINKTIGLVFLTIDIIDVDLSISVNKAPICRDIFIF